MPRKIALILGHPDASDDTYCAALARAYVKGATAGGHQIRRIDLAKLEIEFLHNKEEFAAPPKSKDIADAQATFSWADHLVFLYPLWLGTMPAMMKAFLEQLCTGGFAIETDPQSSRWTAKLKGKSARIIVTMGMPALAYRWFFRAHSLKSFERNILKFAGVGPVKETLIGLVETSDKRRKHWLAKIEKLGAAGN